MAILKAKIVLVPLGEVDFILVNRLATNIGPVFNRSVDILKGMKVPQESYNVIRGQNYASVILNKLERVKANQREFILGLLEEDIYLPDEAIPIPSHGRRWCRFSEFAKSFTVCLKTTKRYLHDCLNNRFFTCRLFSICPAAGTHDA